MHPKSNPAFSNNQLMELLPHKDRQNLLALCEPVELVMSEVLCDAGAATRFVYFPTEGFISLVAPVDGKPSLEVGMVGNEGMLGAQLALNVPISPLHAVVQGPGVAWQMDADAFSAELEQSPGLQAVMNRYIFVLMAQLTSSAACLRFHRIEQRLARWLLMSQDRANADTFHVTHEFLAYMLGVRRVSITTAAGALQRAGWIEYHHGEVTVVNRTGLESAACTCYGVDLAAYKKLLSS